MASEIKQILMQRDGMSADEADDLISLAKEEVLYYIDIGDINGAEDCMGEFFGLEGDYIIDLIPLW